MAKYYASDYWKQHTPVVDRSVVLPDADSTIEGGAVLWVLGTEPTAARTVTVATYDSARQGEYRHTAEKPCVDIKAAEDCSSFDIELQDVDGNVLYTFGADYSSTPIYVKLRLTSTGGWELA